MTSEAIRQYLLRSYTAVDGLWFMKVEERFGFEAALDLDVQVWEVMAKIQARQMKSLLSAGQGVSGLQKCLGAKMATEGFVFRAEQKLRDLDVAITGCHWFDKMVKAGRGNLAAAIGNRICTTEYSVWAREFGCSFQFACDRKICEGKAECRLRFAESS